MHTEVLPVSIFYFETEQGEHALVPAFSTEGAYRKAIEFAGDCDHVVNLRPAMDHDLALLSVEGGDTL